VVWDLACAPSLGGSRKGPGEACQFSDECQSGHCLNGQYCFGACLFDDDCAGGTCQDGNYLGMSISFCQP
jgi:hypothetical protein